VPVLVGSDDRIGDQLVGRRLDDLSAGGARELTIEGMGRAVEVIRLRTGLHAYAEQQCKTAYDRKTWRSCGTNTELARILVAQHGFLASVLLLLLHATDLDHLAFG
jgi:hypothetical protein